jgi:hypothetical protein
VRSSGLFAIVATVCPVALAVCSIGFQTQSAASLKPSATSHIVLLRQNDGSYTGYQMQDASPYGVQKITPGFQNQLTVCPPPIPGLSPDGVAPPQAFARLGSGGYLFLQRSDLFGTPGAAFEVYALEFNASLKLVSQTSLSLSAGLRTCLEIT